MKFKNMLMPVVVIFLATYWFAGKNGYLDRLYLPISGSYGVHFAKISLGENTDTIFHPDYPEFCVIPAYLRTKDGKGTDYDNKITFAHCNATECIASIEPIVAEYQNHQYRIDTPYRNGGNVAFCVADINHITIKASDDAGLILDHGNRASWEAS